MYDEKPKTEPIFDARGKIVGHRLVSPIDIKVLPRMKKEKDAKLDIDFKCPSCGSDSDVDCHCKPGG